MNSSTNDKKSLVTECKQKRNIDDILNRNMCQSQLIAANNIYSDEFDVFRGKAERKMKIKNFSKSKGSKKYQNKFRSKTSVGSFKRTNSKRMGKRRIK